MAGNRTPDPFDDLAGLIDALKQERVDISRTTAKAWSTLDLLLDKTSLDEDDEAKSALAERIIRCAASQQRATPSLFAKEAKGLPGDKLIPKRAVHGKEGRLTDPDGQYMRAPRPPDLEEE